MSYEVIFLEDAQNELKETALYIATDNPQRAIEFTNKIFDFFSESLSLFPELGIKYSEKIRKLSFKKHTAFYTINTNAKIVYILHVVDLTKPLSERGIEI